MVVRLSGFQGDVAVDGSLMLVGDYDDWARLLAALQEDRALTLEVIPLPASETTRPVTAVDFSTAVGVTPVNRLTGAGVLDGDRATIVGLDRFDAFLGQLGEILEYNDVEDLDAPGWHTHFDLDTGIELPTNLIGERLSEIMLSGPRWQ